MVKRIKWEKLAVENKKCAVLAIFYCGLQSVKSFHISPLDRRDCKDRHNFGICKTKATASGGGSCTFYIYRSLRRRPENRCRRTRTVSAISRASSSLRRQLENRCRRTRTVSAISRASSSLRRQLENRCRRTRTVSAISRASSSLRRRRLPRCSRTSRRAPCRGPTSRNGRDRGSRRSRPPVPGD